MMREHIYCSIRIRSRNQLGVVPGQRRKILQLNEIRFEITTCPCDSQTSSLGGEEHVTRDSRTQLVLNYTTEPQVMGLRPLTCAMLHLPTGVWLRDDYRGSQQRCMRGWTQLRENPMVLRCVS
ncbi:hypothetical protein PISMIDRAFT_338588 [Pisolithus microcarpus 441]|uniref:Uncharacterized protein n=1 Tax=Pisolithus microcarpus 441 TaxID=765257 RepID=A0A0D0A0E8_9AGAM|nr:hypothetical protein PISMIDRAFT_338588 [Pisolithus microcarpus 441]